jgi:hypothetical protein
MQTFPAAARTCEESAPLRSIHAFLLLAALVAILLSLTHLPVLASEVPPMDIASLMPDSLGAWHRTGEDARYDRQSIFHYMDGAAEVYLSFAFRELLVRTYAGPDGARLTAELYDMGHDSEAFGIFSRNRQGPEAGIGQGSEYRSGYLVLWQGPYFATLYTDRQGPDQEAAVRELGAAIARGIGITGHEPALLDRLPRADLVPGSVRYFHLYTDLNQHYFVADDNILDLGPDTEAALASYERGEEYAYLLIVRYPAAERARAAFATYREVFLPEAAAGEPVQIEDGTWSAAVRGGAYLLAVFDALSAARATDLLAAARTRLERSPQ